MIDFVSTDEVLVLPVLGGEKLCSDGQRNQLLWKDLAGLIIATSLSLNDDGYRWLTVTSKLAKQCQACLVGESV